MKAPMNLCSKLCSNHVNEHSDLMCDSQVPGAKNSRISESLITRDYYVDLLDQTAIFEWYVYKDMCYKLCV